MGLFSKREVPPWQAPHPDVAARVRPRRRTAAENARISTYILTSLIALVAVLGTMLTALGFFPWPTKYATDIFLVALVFGAGPYGYFQSRALKRVEAIDDKFPDFLRDLAESARAGMTLPRALLNAARGSYGELTPEIQKMSAQVEWGVGFSEALQRFGERVESPLISRIVSLIVEAQRAGGSVVEILSAAAEDAREIKQIVQGRNNQMQAYSIVIYIAFFVFVAIVLVLQVQFIPAFKTAVEAAGPGAKVGGLQFQDFDPEDFNTLFFHASLIQAIGGGLVGGVLTRGSPVGGLKSIIIMVAVSWLAFRFGGG